MVRVEAEVPGSMASEHVRSRVSGTWRTWKGSPPGLQPRMDDTQVHPEPSGYSNPLGMGSGGMWFRGRNAALSTTAINRKPACRHPKGCARGGRLEDHSMADRKDLRP